MNSVTTQCGAALLLLFGLTSSGIPRQWDDDPPKYNPSAPRIAFSMKRDAAWQLYVMDADGRHQTRLVTSDFQDRFAIWSPDGSKIAYGSQRDDDW